MFPRVPQFPCYPRTALNFLSTDRSAQYYPSSQITVLITALCSILYLRVQVSFPREIKTLDTPERKKKIREIEITGSRARDRARERMSAISRPTNQWRFRPEDPAYRGAGRVEEESWKRGNRVARCGWSLAKRWRRRNCSRMVASHPSTSADPAERQNARRRHPLNNEALGFSMPVWLLLANARSLLAPSRWRRRRRRRQGGIYEFLATRFVHAAGRDHPCLFVCLSVCRLCWRQILIALKRRSSSVRFRSLARACLAPLSFFMDESRASSSRWNGFLSRGFALASAR